MREVDLKNSFDYENGFYLTAGVERFSKFATHLDLYRRASGLAGEIVECGVFKGASLFRWIKFRALLENAYSRRIVAFDTFAAFPEANYGGDVQKRAQFVKAAGGESISVPELTVLLERQGLYENIDLVEGDVGETVPAYVENHPELKIALLNIDVDLLEPTRVCLERFYPYLVRGGVLVLDDYGAFAGANKAIDDFFKDTQTVIQKFPYSHNISYVIKP